MAQSQNERNFRIRRFEKGHRQAIVEITLLGFEGVSIDHAIEQRFGMIAGVSWRERKRRDILRDLDQHARDTWVAEVDGRVVGYITSFPDLETRIGWIPNLAVHPDFQGRGIGRALINKALENFRRQGMLLAKIETLAHNTRALKLYRSLGFQEVVRQVHLVAQL